MNEAAAGGTAPPSDNRGPSTALPQLAKPPTVFNPCDNDNGSHNASSDGDNDNNTDDNVEQLILQHDKDEEQNLQQKIEEETHKHTDVEGGELAYSANVLTDEQLKELKYLHITNPSGQTLHKRTWLKMINERTSLTQSMDRKKHVPNVGQHSDYGRGVATENVIIRAFHVGQ